MKNQKVQDITFIGLYVALYVVLKFIGNLIPFLQMPNGGSIELELIAVFIASYHLGWKKGVLTAIVSLLVSFIFWAPYYINPVQLILDYFGPLMACGLASVVWPFKDLNKPAIIICALIVSVGTVFGIINSFNTSTITIIISIVIAILIFIFIYWSGSAHRKFGVVVAMLIKYVFHVLSGVYYYFPDGYAAGSAYAWSFSLIYNLWYNLVTMAVCIIIVPILIDRLKKANIKFID